MVSQITGYFNVQHIIHANNKENTKIRITDLLWGESTGDRKGYIMTSSCVIIDMKIPCLLRFRWLFTDCSSGGFIWHKTVCVWASSCEKKKKKKHYLINMPTCVTTPILGLLNTCLRVFPMQLRHISIMVSWITGNSTVCSTVCSEQQLNKSSALMALCEGNPSIKPVDSLHKGPVIIASFNDVQRLSWMWNCESEWKGAVPLFLSGYREDLNNISFQRK